MQPNAKELALAVQYALGAWRPTPPAERPVELSPSGIVPTGPHPPEVGFFAEASETEASSVASTSPSASDFEPKEDETVSLSPGDLD